MKTIILRLILTAMILSACGQVGVTSLDGNQNNAQESEIREDIAMSYTPVYQPGLCPFSLPAGMIENEDVGCGVLRVPEDRSNPSGGDVELAVAVFHSSAGEDLQPDPIVFVEGGPGAEVLSKLSLVFAKFAPLLEDRDVIFYDPRGVGYSLPTLDCPEYSEVMISAVENNFTAAESEQQGLDALLACGRRLNQEGINLAKYNLHENAADLSDLRISLGYEQWNLFSVSYGTRVVQELIRTSPEGIRSVVLDSAVYPEAAMLEEAPKNISRSLSLLFTSCAADPACKAAYPLLEAQLEDLVESLNAKPVQTPLVNVVSQERFDNVRADGSSILNAVFSGLYSDDLIPYLPKLISDTSNGDHALLASLRSNQFTSQIYFSEGAYYAGICYDQVPFNSPEQIEENSSHLPLLDSFFAQSFGREGLFKLCENWQVGSSNREVNLAPLSDLPTLVLAGQFDPVSPPDWGRQVAERLPHSTFIEFPKISHSVTLSDPCPFRITLAFIDDPHAPLDISCIDQIRGHFVTPIGLADIKFTPISVESAGIHVVVPENWIAAKEDYFVSPDQVFELVVTKDKNSVLEDFLAAWGVMDPGTEISPGSLAWDVYIVPKPEIGKTVFLAVSPRDDGFYLTLVVGPLDQAQPIRDYLFLPVLESFSEAE